MLLSVMSMSVQEQSTVAVMCLQQYVMLYTVTVATPRMLGCQAPQMSQTVKRDAGVLSCSFFI